MGPSSGIQQLNTTLCRHHLSIGTLRNYDGDGKENVKKKNNRFNEQNNNSARASRFFVHLFSVPVQVRREMTKC